MTSEFNGDDATMILEFTEGLTDINFEISYPQFVMNGNWSIDIK
ncbi:hypothetical protein [Clostridium formicaceticum]|nr:hypothetical protein [Clostridium formicaceticum]